MNSVSMVELARHVRAPRRSCHQNAAPLPMLTACPCALQVKAQHKSAFESIWDELTDEEKHSLRGRLGQFVDSNLVTYFMLTLVVLDFIAVLGEIYIWITLVNVCDYKCDDGITVSLSGSFVNDHVRETADGVLCVEQNGFARPADASRRQLGYTSDVITCSNFTGLNCHMSCHIDAWQHEFEIYLHWVSIAALAASRPHAQASRELAVALRLTGPSCDLASRALS